MNERILLIMIEYMHFEQRNEYLTTNLNIYTRIISIFNFYCRTGLKIFYCWIACDVYNSSHVDYLCN